MAEESRAKSLREAHAAAYRAYVNTLRESLAEVDIEAVDVTQPSAALPIYTYQSFGTHYTYYTYQTFYSYHTTQTLGTSQTIGTLATEASIE